MSALLASACGQGPTELVVGVGGAAGHDAAVVLDGPSLQDVPGPTPCKDPKDSDNDGIADELELAPNTDTDSDGTPDFLDDDSDGDGWLDKDEAANPFLSNGSPGRTRENACSALADTDADGIPDVRDVDSDGDGIADADEKTLDPDGTLGCRVKPDCDGDAVVDPVEVAAGSSPTDASSIPPDATLYFVLPYQKPERTKDFDFSTGVKMADIYFLVDTTDSMQAAIDNVASSLDTKILPAILNGDPAASPPIPAIPGAWVGVGDFRDIPWAPWGATTDKLYRSRFPVGSDMVLGNVSAPEQGPGGLVAPQNVRSILGTLQASGGGDAPEGQTQAMWIAASGQDYAATGLGFWKPDPPMCTPPGSIGTPCFRPGALPLFVLITDAPMHNGPVASWDYTPSNTGGTHPYQDTVDAINAIGGKVLGVSVNTGTPGAAREDMKALATQTASLYHDDAFGGHDYPLVTEGDTATGDVSDEVVRLIGLLSGQGLHNVTTVRSNYDCAGNVDCNGDGNADPEYHNPTLGGSAPFDGSQLILNVEPVESTAVPKPYTQLDATTFYGVRGDATVTFKVHAQNTLIKPSTLVVLRAMIRVQTPGGQQLGGPDGVKVVYLVIPRYVEQTY
ncbi:MAG: hypothetical protein HY898_28275 [Deltaproteobacteria bacterium]|nr:hypothetical protein [Deltaproteobacteria bacterium]